MAVLSDLRQICLGKYILAAESFPRITDLSFLNANVNVLKERSRGKVGNYKYLGTEVNMTVTMDATIQVNVAGVKGAF